MPFSPNSFPTDVDIYTGLSLTAPPFFALRLAGVPALILSAYGAGVRGLSPLSSPVYTHVVCFAKGTDIRDNFFPEVILTDPQPIGDFIALAGEVPSLHVVFAEKRNQGQPTEYVRVYCVRRSDLLTPDF